MTRDEFVTAYRTIRTGEWLHATRAIQRAAACRAYRRQHDWLARSYRNVATPMGAAGLRLYAAGVGPRGKLP